MTGKKKNAPAEYYPSALTIAGSDSGGGAGIQADLRTFNALGVYGCTAITAVTSQNPEAVSAIETMPASCVTSQIEAVMAKIAVRTVKTGMLGSVENVEAVIKAAKKYNFKPVCDPVMISTSGRKLQSDAALDKTVKELFPLARWITPNIPDSAFSLGRNLAAPAEFAQGALELAEKFKTNVFLKGGHDEKNKESVDYICCKGKVWCLSSPRIQLPPTASHGTGCTLAAALAALTALEFPWEEVVVAAKSFVLGSLRENVEIGKDVFGMYPPMEDASAFVDLYEYKNGGATKGKLKKKA